MSHVTMMSKKRPEPLHLVFYAMGGLVLMFVVAPLVGMLLNCSGGELAEAALDPEVTSSIWLTLWVSMAGTLLCALAVIPFAYVLARKDFPLKRLVIGVIDIPIVIPHSAAGIAVLGMVARKSALGKVAAKVGLNFIDAPAGGVIESPSLAPIV